MSDAPHIRRWKLPRVCPYCGAEIVNSLCRCKLLSRQKVPALGLARFQRPEFFNEPDPLVMASARPALASGGVRNGSRG